MHTVHTGLKKKLFLFYFLRRLVIYRGPREKTEAAGRINHKIRRVSKIPVEDTVAQCLAPVNVTL